MVLQSLFSVPLQDEKGGSNSYAGGSQSSTQKGISLHNSTSVSTSKCLWDTTELPDAELPAKQAVLHMIAIALT